MRCPVLPLLLLLAAACGGGDSGSPTDGGTPPPSPPVATAPDLTVGASGGTVVVSLASTPINGISITVPSGAFTGSQRIGVSYADNAGFAHPAGTTLLTPRIIIRTSDGALASRPMLLTIPVTVPSGTFPQVVLRNPVNGRQRALPTVAYTATSVTAMTGHFNGNRLMASNGSFAPTAQGASLSDPAATADLAVVALPLDLLSQDHDTQFRPGVDDWEFRTNETVREDDFSTGIVGTEAWYFVAQKGQHGALSKKFQKADGIEASNRDGLRWVSMAESEIYSGMTEDLNSVVADLVASGQGTVGTVKQRLTVASFNAVRAALTTSPGEPQMVLLFDASSAGQAVLVYRATGQQLFAADPANPGTPLVIDFSSGTMAPVTLGGGSTVYTTMVTPGYSIIENDGELPGQFSDVLAGTIGEDDFPTYRPMIAWGTAPNERTELTGGIAYTFDTNPPVIWMDCLSCIGDARIASIPPGTEKVSLMEVYTQKGTAPWTGPSGAFGLSSPMAAPGEMKVGINLATHRQTGETTFYWTDWFGFTLRRLTASVAPTSAERGAGKDIPLTFSITGAPGNLEYVWDFADGPAVTTTTLTTTHKWANGGSYTVKATARDKTTKQPVAKATVDVSIGALLPVWKFTSMTVTTSRNPSPPIGPVDPFRADSQHYTRMRDGLTEGGIFVIERDSTLACTVCLQTTLGRGLYLVEGVSLTRSTLAVPPIVSFLGSVINYSLLPAPGVRGWPVAGMAKIIVNPPCTRDGDPGEFWTQTGDLLTGRVTGKTVHRCAGPPDQSGDLPLYATQIMAVDVTFAGDVATGTITGNYIGVNFGPLDRAQIVVTFQARRVVQ